MFPEIEKFKKHLWRQSLHTSTYRHYVSDLRLFFTWAGKPPTAITISDVDAYRYPEKFFPTIWSRD